MTQIGRSQLIVLSETGALGKQAAEHIARQREEINKLQTDLSSAERQVRDQARLIQKLHRENAALKSR